ncbi:survival motor neuron protein isoform X4 [Cherax quadricarinatus]|uniref:survival motor neuron protein isoform X4 n=1 Tax=Cherax quadricarinatus TaxID=27406 RepID=UPI00237877A9|nr:survival motor neuron protein-like isoform X4 [Cherax quadricarinatus]
MASDTSQHVLYNANDAANLTHEEMWDDTLLIQQYDQAMAQVRQKLQRRVSAANTTESEQSEAVEKAVESLSESKIQMASLSKKKKKRKNKRKNEWKTGDACRAKYSEDGLWYEGTVVGLNAATGMCTVRFVGFNNEEEVLVNRLAKSKGEAARRKQIELADDGQSESDLCSSLIESDMQSDTDAERSNKRQRAPHTQRSYSGSPHLPQLPPPPALTMDLSNDPQSSEALHTMLMSWYMTGYHTGYYQGLRQAQTRKPHKK